jgi:hypothetical protein
MGVMSGLVRVLTALVGLATLVLVVVMLIIAGVVGAAVVVGVAGLAVCLALPVVAYVAMIRRWPALRIRPMHRWIERRFSVASAMGFGGSGPAAGDSAGTTGDGREGVRVRGAADR